MELLRASQLQSESCLMAGNTLEWQVSWDCAKRWWSCIPVLNLLCAAATCQVCRLEWALLILPLAWHPGLSHASLCCLPAETCVISLHDLSYSTRCACSTICTLCALVWTEGTHHDRKLRVFRSVDNDQLQLHPSWLTDLQWSVMKFLAEIRL